jgi:hypothetical protein
MRRDKKAGWRVGAHDGHHECGCNYLKTLQFKLTGTNGNVGKQGRIHGIEGSLGSPPSGRIACGQWVMVGSSRVPLTRSLMTDFSRRTDFQAGQLKPHLRRKETVAVETLVNA